ncbi:ribonuclease MRP complex subunit [Schizosaccharomyces japonicus yFS275]|uniref:Ribonuclease MRP complex subunit n=1 Tax=Schizosaccharomyces japonicus (strain yFS275 / FY16936) TaxID=402676 RepID=B6K5H8_SCHJY|nr:ribonuclease MRP complex subunit [Schizosaccharomyces japonicus yFS275]EEB08782.1 ribonuclease MRP complex subunit [Schizosaccharomyces japonicus yFS275]
MDSLACDLQLLQRIVHRNTNQHRLSVWWRHLRMLQRRLTQALQGNEDSARKLLAQCPKSYYYFSNLIAHGQFPALGMVFVGILSRVWVVFSRELGVEVKGSELTDDKGDLMQVDNTENNEDTGVKISRKDLTKSVHVAANSSIPSKPSSRVSSPLQKTDDSLPVGLKTKKKKTRTEKKPVKKRKKTKHKDEIDDIFGF